MFGTKGKGSPSGNFNQSVCCGGCGLTFYIDQMAGRGSPFDCPHCGKQMSK